MGCRSSSAQCVAVAAAGRGQSGTDLTNRSSSRPAKDGRFWTMPVPKTKSAISAAWKLRCCGVEPGVDQRLDRFRMVMNERRPDDQVVGDGAGELGGRGDGVAAGTLERLGGERRGSADGVDLAARERRGRRRVRRLRVEYDILLAQTRLPQGEQEQVVVDRSLYDRDLPALEIGDAGDAVARDDLVVSGGVVVDQNHCLFRSRADRDQRVVERLAVGVKGSGFQRQKAVGVVSEVL